MTAKEIITKCYKAILSTKESVQIDPGEIDTVMKGAANGQLVRVRQGLINPSYLVAIVEDKERKSYFLEDTKYHTDRRAAGMKPLSDIFAKEAPRLAGPPGEEGRTLSDPKKLT